MPTLYNKDALIIEMRLKEAGHKVPHVHALYQGESVSIDFNGKVIIGKIKQKQQDIACQWVASHKFELQQLWKEMH